MLISEKYELWVVSELNGIKHALYLKSLGVGFKRLLGPKIFMLCHSSGYCI